MTRRGSSPSSSQIHWSRSPSELRACVDKLFAKSDLVIAQEWLPTAFDWRVGIFDRRALYVCKYFMAPGHWQVIKREADRRVDGSTLAMTVGEAPETIVKTAVRAANLIGDGFYGVDVKEANETSEIYLQPLPNNQLGGLAIISAEPTEVSSMNVAPSEVTSSFELGLTS